MSGKAAENVERSQKGGIFVGKKRDKKTSISPNAQRGNNGGTKAQKKTGKGLSTRVRICVGIAIRFRARFVQKQNREPILFPLTIAMVCLHISAKNNQKKNLLHTFGSKSYTESYGDSYGKSHV
jgi:hypothetical protein